MRRMDDERREGEEEEGTVGGTEGGSDERRKGVPSGLKTVTFLKERTSPSMN